MAIVTTSPTMCHRSSADRPTASSSSPPTIGRRFREQLSSNDTEKGIMMTATQTTTRTQRLLALMRKGDDLFNARDWEALGPIHHPDMIAHIPGSPQPIYG